MSKTNVRINYSKDFTGCVIRLEDIELMLNIINEYINNIRQYEEGFLVNTKIDVYLKNQPSVNFSSFEELKNDNKMKIYLTEKLSIRISSSYLVDVQIEYYDNGNVELEISGYYSELNDCWNHLYNTLHNIMRHRDMIDKIFFRKNIISTILIFSIIYIIISLINIYSSSRNYFLAEEIGVNIEESLIPLNNTIFLDIEKAIKSDDLILKLDTLLRINLRGFINSIDYIERQIIQIRNNFIRLISTIIGISLIIVKSRKTQSFNITIGLNEEYHRKKEKYKYFWLITIFLAILINIVSNIISRIFIDKIF